MGEAAGNATKAAILAGYGAKRASVTGSELVRKRRVSEVLTAEREKASQEAGITRERVLAETALLAFSDVTHYSADDNGDIALMAGAPAGAMRAVQSIKRRTTFRGTGKDQVKTVEVEIKLWDKPGPLKLAGQHVGLFKDAVEHKHDLGDLIAQVAARRQQLNSKP